MAYTALYRRFRPRTFDEMAGQAHITGVLKRQIETGSVSHAYLFCGPRGTGKTSAARILAGALNCVAPKEGSPCLECARCREAAAEGMVDVMEIDAASNNSVDNIRDLREKVNLLPMRGKYKIYIIDEAHMLSAGAFNALLKTLEEPPAHAVFILATTELRKLPKTIVSRCQQFDFHRIDTRNIVSALQKVAEQSGIAYEPEALAQIARMADGAMRDALSLLDVCAAGDSKVTGSRLCELLGAASGAQVKELADCVQKCDTRGGISLIHTMYAAGVQAEHILSDLLDELCARLPGAADEEELRALTASCRILIEAAAGIRYSMSPLAHATTAFVRCALPGAAQPDNMGARLAALEKKLTELEVKVRARPVVAPAPDATKGAPAAQAPKSADAPAQPVGGKANADSSRPADEQAAIAEEAPPMSKEEVEAMLLEAFGSGGQP